MQNHQGRQAENPKDSNLNQKIIKILLICFISILVVPHQSDTFWRFPSLYYASRVFLSTGLFTETLGLIFSGGPSGVRFSRFCVLYSSISLGFLVILIIVSALFPESDLPMWFRKQVYATALSLTNPYPLFLLLALLLPAVLFFPFSVVARFTSMLPSSWYVRIMERGYNVL